MARGMIAEFLVNITSRGAKTARGEVEGLGKSVRQTGEAHAHAEKAAATFYHTQEKGVIGTANSTKSFSKMAHSVNGGSGSLVGAYATLAANVFAVSAAFNALRSAAQVEQVLNGLNAAGARTGLTLEVTANKVKALSDGMLTTEQSARSTAQFMAAGFTTQSLERMTVLSKDLSIALGRNMTDSMDRLTRGVVKLEPELLDELGIMTKIGESSAAYAAQLGKSTGALTNFEKRQGFMNAVLAEGELKFGGISKAASDTVAFDKLAATFADLTKDIFGFLANATSGMANFLSQTKLGLSALGILFASTVSRQLLPGLAEASERAAQVAEQTKARNIQKVDKLSNTFNDDKLNIGTTWVAAIKDGTADTKLFREEIAELKGETRDWRVQQQLASSEVMSAARAEKALAAELDKVEARYKGTGERASEVLTARGNLILAEQRHTKALKDRAFYQDEANRLERAGVLASSVEATRRKGDAHTRAAQAIQQASAGDFGQGIGSLTASIREYNKAGEDSTKKTNLFGKTLNTLNTTMFGVAKGAQFLGATLLTALPYIGLAIGAVALAMEAWNAITGKNTKENKAFRQSLEDLGKISDSVNDKISNYNRIMQSTVANSLKVEQATTLQANAITELANAYITASEKAAELEKAEARRKEGGPLKLRTSRGANLFDDRASQVAQQLKLNQDSVAVKAFNRLTSSPVSGLVDKAGDEAVTALAKFEQLDPKGMSIAMVKYSKEIREAGNDTAKLRAVSLKVTKDVADNWTGTTDAIKNLTESLKAADLAFGAFFRSSAQSTPYDDVVKKVEAVTTAITDMKTASIRNGTNSGLELLGGIGPDMLRFLDSGTKAEVERLRVTEQTAAVLEKRKIDQKYLNKEDTVALGIANQTVSRRTEILGNLENQIIKTEELFKKAQLVDRTNKSTLALMQAQVQVRARINSTTGAGVREQMQMENKILDQQKAGLQAQIDIYEQLIINLSVNEKQLEIMQGMTAQAAIHVAQEKLRAIHQEKSALAAAAEGKGTGWFMKMLRDRLGMQTSDERAAQTRLRFLAEEEEKANTLLETAKAVKSNENEIAAIRASQAGLQSQQAVLDTQRTTAAQQQAAYDTKRAENLKEQVSAMNQLRGINNEILQAHKRINVIVSGRKGTLRDELDIVKQTREEAVETAKAARAEAVAQLDTLKVSQRGDIDSGLASAAVQAEINSEYQKNLDIIDKTLQARYAQADVTATLNTLERINFDIHKEGIEWQKDGLGYLEKQMAARKEYLSISREINQVDRQIADKRMGYQDLTAFDLSNEIEAAAEAYRLAVEESNLRKSIIKMEFALLNAQHAQLLSDLTLRRNEALALQASGNPLYGPDSTLIRQLNSAVEQLTNNAPDFTMLGMQLGAVDQSIRLLGKKADLVSTTAGRNGSRLLNALEGFERIDSARRQSEATRQNAKPAGGVFNSVLPTGDARDGINAEARKSLDATIKSQQGVIEALDRLTKTLGGELSTLLRSSTAAEAGENVVGVSGNGRANIVALGKMIQQMGLKVWEHPEFGGVKGKHEGRAHGEGRAIDVYSRAGNGEYNDPVERARYDALQKQAESMGAKVLWKVEGHFNHMHIEFADTMEKLSDIATVTSAKTGGVPVRVTNAAEISGRSSSDTLGGGALGDKLSTLVDEIVVTGAARAPKLDTSVVTAPGMSTQMAQIPQFFPPHVEKDYSKYFEYSNKAMVITQDLADQLQKLGPAGEAVLAVRQGMLSIGDAYVNAAKIFDDPSSSMSKKFIAGAEVASAALSTITSVLDHASQARIAGIDAEIAAEQRRDGKSAASLARIQALEARREASAKKAFNTNKKLIMAQAVISTAAAVAAALAAPPGPPWNLPFVALAGAMGAAQLAIIAGTSYQSTASSSNPATATQTPSLSIGKRGDTVDLARNNSNAGGELGYLRGAKGMGRNASDYAVIGSAYGGRLGRGYGNTAMVIGEKGPELLTPTTPMTVRPMETASSSQTIAPTFNIHAIDSESVHGMLLGNRGNIIEMLREAANNSGQTFLEDVNTNIYNRPNKL
jgi:hypothetical protein